jgi:uncharacterized membrane protein YhaH (DUF805 family)
MNWYLKVLKEYANFEGRARRKEYWMFLLFNSIFFITAIIIDNILGITYGRDIFYGPFYTLYVLAVFIPGLAVSVRRLHDVGKSGWYYLIILIPLAGPIWFIVLVATDSNPGENEYGKSPKSENSERFEAVNLSSPQSINTTQEISQSSKPKLPNAIGILILGISSILMCATVILGIICGIIALVMSKSPKAMLLENPNGFSNSGILKAGRITAIIGIILSILYVPMVLLIIAMDN